MPFRRDLPRTLAHPKIQKFLAICDDLSESPIINAEHIKSTRFLSFLDSIFILRWDKKEADFKYHYWGSRVARAYDAEPTGMHLRSGPQHEFTEKFIAMHLEAMTEKKRIFLGGNLDWLDKEFRTWDQVTMPLERDGIINETLTYIQFNLTDLSL